MKLKRLAIIGLIIFFVLFACGASAALQYGLCDSITISNVTELTCNITATRNNNTMGQDNSKLSQAQIDGFWTAIPPTATKVTWLIQNAEVYTKDGENVILHSGEEITWDISLSRTSSTTSLRSNANGTITFTNDVSNVSIDGDDVAGAFIQGGTAAGSGIMTDISGDLVIRNRGLITNANTIKINGKMLMENHANMTFTHPSNSLLINGVAGEDSMTMTNSEFDFEPVNPGQIIVSNGNINISGVNPTYAIRYPKSIEANNGNITVQGTNRSESIWQVMGGPIKASGNIAITDAQIDGYDTGGPPGGTPSGITEFKAGGNITTKSNTASNNPILGTVQGPIIAGGKITFEGQSANDMLLGDYSVTGLFANELEIKNAKLEGITYNVVADPTKFTDDTKYGPIKITGLMELENADLSGNWSPSLGKGIRWVKAGALEMSNQSKLHLRGDITIQEYAEIIDSIIEIHDLEEIDDPQDSPRKIEIVNPNSPTKPAFYLKGVNQGVDGQQGITMHFGTSSLEILNDGDEANGVKFKNTIIKANNTVTINSCTFDVTGNLNVTSAQGSKLITKDSGDNGAADLAKLTDSTNFSWEARAGCTAASTCTISSLAPPSFSTTDTFPKTTDLTVSANGFGANPELHIESCGSGTPVQPNCKVNTPGDCACTYDTNPLASQTITGRIGSTDCTPIAFVCSDCGAQPVLPAADVFVSDIQLSTEKALFIGGTQTVTVTIENTSGNDATGNLEISIIGPTTSNSAACSFSNQTLAIGTTTLNCTFSPAGPTVIPFDKVGVYKAMALISGVEPASSDPIKANNSSEAFFFVAAKQEKTIPETAVLLLPIITLVILYITSGRLKQ